MKHLKSYNSFNLNEEVLIESDDRQNFIDEIKDIFIDTVVDNSNIEELSNEDNYDSIKDFPGIFYHLNDYQLSLDINNPYLEVLIYSGYDYFDQFENMQILLNKFCEIVDNIGYEVIQEMDIKEYIDSNEDDYYPEAFVIKIIYRK